MLFLQSSARTHLQQSTALTARSWPMLWRYAKHHVHSQKQDAHFSLPHSSGARAAMMLIDCENILHGSGCVGTCSQKSANFTLSPGPPSPALARWVHRHLPRHAAACAPLPARVGVSRVPPMDYQDKPRSAFLMESECRYFGVILAHYVLAFRLEPALEVQSFFLT
jgi:hypothetical protein